MQRAPNLDWSAQEERPLGGKSVSIRALSEQDLCLHSQQAWSALLQKGGPFPLLKLCDDFGAKKAFC